MKKKHRDIRVGGIDYAWIAREDGTVTIWRDKKVVCNGIAYGSAVVTPSIIAEAILTIASVPTLVDSVIDDITEREFLQSELEDRSKEVDHLRQRIGAIHLKLTPTAKTNPDENRGS